MKWWMWLLVAGGVFYVMMEREKAAVKISANKAATGAVDALGKGTVKIIDASAAAVGRWVGTLFSGQKSTTNTSGSTGVSSARSDDLLDVDWA